MSDANHGGKGDRSRVSDHSSYNKNFDKIFKQQYQEVSSVRKDKRKQRLNEIGMLQYFVQGGKLDSRRKDRDDK